MVETFEKAEWLWVSGDDKSNVGVLCVFARQKGNFNLASYVCVELKKKLFESPKKTQ